MENASKALIIAGGMLLFILVLSFAVYLFRKVGNQTSEFYKEMSESDISEFNNEFYKYENKDDLNIQDVVSIVNLIRNNNENGKFSIKITAKIKIKDTEETNQDTIKLNELLENRENYAKKFKCTLDFSDEIKIVKNVNIIEK